jgi:hypothetical protein
VKSVSLAGDMHTEFEIDDLPSGLGWMPDGSMLIGLLYFANIACGPDNRGDAREACRPLL